MLGKNCQQRKWNPTGVIHRRPFHLTANCQLKLSAERTAGERRVAHWQTGRHCRRTEALTLRRPISSMLRACHPHNLSSAALLFLVDFYFYFKSSSFLLFCKSKKSWQSNSFDFVPFFCSTVTPFFWSIVCTFFYVQRKNAPHEGNVSCRHFCLYFC